LRIARSSQPDVGSAGYAMQRPVQLDQHCTIRFPGRNEEFTSGVEIGVLATLMDLGHYPIERRISTGNIEQARDLARAFGYRLWQGGSEGDWTYITLAPRFLRPQFKVVSRQR
jgi:hypothetical protein